MNTDNIGYPTYPRRRRSKLLFQFISAVLVPILLGVFTIIFTIQQEAIAKANRDVDLRIAAEEHQQNLDLAIDEQHNTQFMTYIREISDLLLANNFSLNEQILKSIVRPKTLNTLRQIDSIRKSYLLRFLYESQLMPTINSSFLSLSKADFRDIQIGSNLGNIRMPFLVLSEVDFDSASFIGITFDYSDFSRSNLRGALCYLSSFNYVTFHTTQLQKANFMNTHVYKADFSNANMTDAIISQSQINSAGSISQAILPNGSRGRNSNLFIDPNCEKSVNDDRIQQTNNISEYRRWMIRIGRIKKLFYRFSGWFDKRDNLHVNFTEYNQNGILLYAYCFGNQSLMANHVCRWYQWDYPRDSPSNYSNQYKEIVAKLELHNESYTVNIDIFLGQKGTCRNVYFSIETV